MVHDFLKKSLRLTAWLIVRMEDRDAANKVVLEVARVLCKYDKYFVHNQGVPQPRSTMEMM